MADDALKPREAMAKEYDTIHNRLFVIQILVIAVLLAVYQFSGASAALANGLSVRFGENQWYISNAVYTLTTIFGFAACMCPLSFYSDHVLERHYIHSDETFGEWLADFSKSLMIDLLLATIIFSVIYALLRVLPNWWWLFATIFYILFAVVLATWVPAVIMPLFHKFESLQEGELTQAVCTMAEQAGIEVVGVYKWGVESGTQTANAAFAGLGRRKKIIIGDSLLSRYSQEEILVILAHEIGHYKNRDTLRLMFTSSALALIGFYISHQCLTGLSGALGFASIYDIGAAPLFIFSLFVFSLVSMPFSNMYSRRREYAADAYAIQTMGSPDALVSACEKLADQNMAHKEPSAWAEFFLHSHPSSARRIARAKER
jgi:STE24 endopeptidase